ncbi:MAG: insulinase family protein [Oscillospiraceae bacterium]|nr:insulinase family protein [Oscillospiraceae bacterium]
MEEKVTALFPGVNLTTLRTERFHSGCFLISLQRPLCRKEASLNALLMSVLRRGTRTRPDMESLSQTLDTLYGTSLEPGIRQRGEVMSIGFQAVFPDDRLLPETEKVLEQVVALSGEMLLEPATSGGLLRDDYVRSEGQNLHDRVAAAVNNKRGYALKRARELMFAGENYGVYPLGEAEEALRIRHRALTEHYRKVLQTSPMELFYCGSAEHARVENALRRAFMILPGTGERPLPATVPAGEAGEVRRVTEEMDVEQGNLVIGFRRGRKGDANLPALMVFNELFGGGPSSRLFMNVREKRSLCYYVGSSVDQFKESMTVSAGIGFDRAREAEEAILFELERLTAGEIPGEDLATAKKSVASDYLSALDSPIAIGTFRLSQSLLGAGGDLRQFAELVSAVTAEEVARIASEMRPGLVYFLRRGEEE